MALMIRPVNVAEIMSIRSHGTRLSQIFQTLVFKYGLSLGVIAAIISKSSVASSSMTSRMSSMVIMPTILFSPSTTGSEIRSYFLIVWDASS